MNDKVLIITYDYHPLVTPNSFRWSNVAEHLVARKYQVFVIAAWKPQLAREEVLNGVHVYRVGGHLVESLRSFLSPQSKRQPGKSHKTLPSCKQGPSTFLKSIHDLTWKNIYWPDFACTWFFPALTMAKQIIDRESIFRYITVSIPFTSHLVGNTLKALYPRSEWVVDISDPFCFLTTMRTNNHFLYSRLNYSAEKSIFKNAKVISILTKSQKEKYSELFPDAAGKITVNPNILNHDVAFFPQSRHHGEEKIKLVFIGMLKREVRTPEVLLQIFSLLSTSAIGPKLELHFYGGIEYCEDFFAEYQGMIGRNIFLHGIVPRTTALQAMHDADFLVNIGNTNPYQEPSKVVEYASTGKPIINIISIKADSSRLLLQEYPAVFNIFPNSASQISDGIASLVPFIVDPPTVDAGRIRDFLKPYMVESVVDNYESMLFDR